MDWQVLLSKCAFISIFQQHSCCQYGILAGADASDNGSIGGWDCLMIPGIRAKLFMFSHT